MTAVLHLTNTDHPGKRYAIEQGATFRKVTLLHERNLTGWTPKGEIRTDYKEQGGTVIAEFTFEPLEYKAVLICKGLRTRTVIVPTLTNVLTETMGATWVANKMIQRRDANDMALIGKNVWVYDIGVTDGTQTLRVAQGYAEMDLGVTEV